MRIVIGKSVRADPTRRATRQGARAGASLGLPHPVRLLDRLIGEHLRHGGVDPALGQRGRDLRLLERRVGQIAVLYRLTSDDVP